LNFIDTDNWVPFAAGLGLMVFAAGISVADTRLFPLWFGIAGIVFGAATFTPLGFVGVLACALWLIVISIWMSLRAGAAGTVTLPPN
jgi:hypothetical protein